MHVADPAIGILGANAIVGASMPLAVGAALVEQAARAGPGRRRVLRRGRGQPGLVPRVAQPRRDLGPARRLRVREQRLRRVHRQPPDDPRAVGRRALPRLRRRRRARRRQRRRGGVRGRVERRPALPRRRRPGPDRGRDLPLARPLRGRRPALQARGRGRRLARPRPARRRRASTSSAPALEPRRACRSSATRRRPTSRPPSSSRAPPTPPRLEEAYAHVHRD